MIHVASIERSVEFYRLLGFEIGNREPHEGPPHWVWLYAPKAPEWRRGANLMLTRTKEHIAPDAQRVLLYVYVADVVAQRDQLIATGVAAGEITHPPYLRDGEFETKDPDGYVLMIAQAGPDTP